MIQKFAENLPVFVGLIVVILALYSCAFRRIRRERRSRAETVREKLLSADDTNVRNRR